MLVLELAEPAVARGGARQIQLVEYQKVRKLVIVFIISNMNFLEIAQIVIPPPPVQGQGLTLAELSGIIATIGSFLTSTGVIIAIIAIVFSGIMYMKAGGSPDAVKKAQSWFKNAIIGAFIILAVGLIINTIANVVTRQFFCTLQVSLPPIVNICVF